MLGVGDRVTDDALEEELEASSGLVVDESRDTLDTTSSGQTSDCRLGNSGAVVSQDLGIGGKSATGRPSSDEREVEELTLRCRLAPPFPRPLPPLPRPDMLLVC